MSENNSNQSIRALIAEDNPLNARLLQLQLLKLGIEEVVIASEGSQLLACWQEREYALILLDSQLPGKNGAEIAKEIRQREAAAGRQSAPMIAVSGDATPAGRSSMLEAGCNDFLLKPVRLEDLRKTVQRAVFQKQASKINYDTVMEIKNMNPHPSEGNGIWEELLQGFSSDTSMRLSHLDEAIGNQNMSVTAEIAHALKSGALTIGAEYFAALCHDMERYGVSGDVDQARQLLPKLKPAFLEAMALFDRLE